MTSVPHCICGEFDFTPNVEAFESLGKLVCDDCADDLFSANSPLSDVPQEVLEDLLSSLEKMVAGQRAMAAELYRKAPRRQSLTGCCLMALRFILRETAALAAVIGFCWAVINIAAVAAPIFERVPG